MLSPQGYSNIAIFASLGDLLVIEHALGVVAVSLRLCMAVRLPAFTALCPQRDGFSSDSVRLVREVKKGKPPGLGGVQILLFSATFADDIKQFAHSVIGEQANQVSIPCWSVVICNQLLSLLCTE